MIDIRSSNTALRQHAALRLMLDVTRELYNALLQERRDAYRYNGVTVTTRMQYAELTSLRADAARLWAVYRESRSESETGSTEGIGIAFR